MYWRHTMKTAVNNLIQKLDVTPSLLEELNMELAKLRVKQAKTYLESTILLLEIATLEMKIKEAGSLL